MSECKMHTLQSDKNARAQQQLRNSSLTQRCCNSQNICSKRLTAEHFNSSYRRVTQNSTTTDLPAFKQFQNLLQPQITLLFIYSTFAMMAASMTTHVYVYAYLAIINQSIYSYCMKISIVDILL